LAISSSFSALASLALILGSFPPGIVPLALARVHELVPHHHQQQVAWSRATVSFATFQAIAGFAYSALFNLSGGQHALLFEIAAGAIVVALVLEIFNLKRSQPRSTSQLLQAGASPEDVHNQKSAARRLDALVGPKAATARLLIADAH
jgi:hypothetical protein